MERCKLDGSPQRPPVVARTGLLCSTGTAVLHGLVQPAALGRTLALIDGFGETLRWPGVGNRVGPWRFCPTAFESMMAAETGAPAR